MLKPEKCTLHKSTKSIRKEGRWDLHIDFCSLPTKTKQKNFKGINPHKEERGTKFWKTGKELGATWNQLQRLDKLKWKPEVGKLRSY